MTVREEAKWCIQSDGILAEIRKKLKRGNATYEDTAAYSARAGKMIGALFSRRLPEIPPEEREQLCVELLHDQYIDINAAVDAAQSKMDELLGLHLAPQHAPFDAERGHQIGSALRDLSKPMETLQRRAKAATETATKAMHDDRMKSEAKFRSKAGLKCYITRKAVSGCCAWCTAMAGRFEYGEEPDDIYRRHDNCDCTVTFENGRKRQDVWSKREWEAPAEDAGAPEPVRLTQEQAEALQKEKQLHVLTNGTEHGKMMSNSAETAGSDVHFIGKLDRTIFSCVTSDIVTDEVIITDERIQHIKDRHPNDFERYYRYMQEIIVAPDYIIEANKPNTALILKSFDDGLPFKTVLRLVTSSDDKEFKNSIITFMKINEKEWNRMIKNKNVLYKSE